MINSDNPVQMNIKFTFPVYEYIIVYEYILLSKLIYIYTYIHIIFLFYIYIYMDFVRFVYCTTVVTHAHDGHNGFTFTYSFSAGFTWSLLLVETAYPIVNMTQVIDKKARAT